MTEERGEFKIGFTEDRRDVVVIRDDGDHMHFPANEVAAIISSMRAAAWREWTLANDQRAWLQTNGRVGLTAEPVKTRRRGRMIETERLNVLELSTQSALVLADAMESTLHRVMAPEQ